MVTGFYAALAASASVFIGILTALLASNLSNLKAERDRIERRVETINARLSSLKERKREYQDKIENIDQKREENDEYNKAYNEINDFIFDHVGLDFRPSESELTEDLVLEELKEFLDKRNLNKYHHEILEERWGDIESELNSMSGFGHVSGLAPDSELIAADKRSAEHWKIHTDRQYKQNERYVIQTHTEIRSLEAERQKLKERYRSLTPTQIIRTLYVCVGTIVLSVGVPLATYLLRVTDTTIVTTPPWVEPLVVFLIWILGLAIVFGYLNQQLGIETDNLPEALETTVPDQDLGAESDTKEQHHNVSE